MVKFAYLIPLVPLLGFAVNILFGRQLKLRGAQFSIVCMAASFILSVAVLKEMMLGTAVFEQEYLWFSVGDYAFKVGCLIDNLSAMMLVVVATVALLVQIYSLGYMHGDEPYGRFFAYLSLFTASMLLLVLSPNLVQTYIAWELMGLCSYLLISYWYQRPSAAEAGRKAFITTRIGDTGFFMGLATLFFYFGNVNFGTMAHKIHEGGLNQGVLTVAALLIFCGAVGKSAQFPLHVWLPDAMEGPTPVSALIHAATMVAAGIYLIARTFPVFAAAPVSLEVVAVIGIVTSCMAATIAMVQTDIKRVLAYSTISQLGFMVMGLGVGGYTPGLFHLMSHAFFKALLFLCAGAVIHGTGTQDISRLGGLFKKMRVTATTCLIGSLAIAGIPPLSGFWSKDEILAAVYAGGHHGIFVAALIVAFMTAFYTFRLIFLTFFGPPRDSSLHPHEVTASMRWPLLILVVPSIFFGLLGSPLTHHYFSHFISLPGATHAMAAGGHEGHGGAPARSDEIGARSRPDDEGRTSTPDGASFVMALSIIVGIAGVLLAWLFYVACPKVPSRLAAAFRPIYTILFNKYGLDEFYQKVIVRPFLWLTKRAFSFDASIIDGAVNAAATVTAALSRAKQWVDKNIVDGAVNGVGFLVSGTGEFLRRLQTGAVQHYILFVFLSLGVIIFSRLFLHVF